MRLMFLGLFIISAFLTASTGCQKKSNDQFPSGGIQVQIPWFSDGSYQLKIVDLFSVSDMVELKGWAARFYMTPKIDAADVVGVSPRIHTVRNQQGVYVAADDLSLQLITFYAHLEKLAMMDESAGAKDFGVWPKKVAVQTNFMGPDGLSHDNAFYLGSANAFVFVPYTRAGLPVMVNAGVVAHEHFHSLFQSVVLDKVDTPQRLAAGLFNPHEARNAEWLGRLGQVNARGAVEMTARDQYQAVMIRGLNEGLADVWGWIYTNDSVFVGRSLPEFKEMRNLDVRDGALFSESSLKEFNSMNGFTSSATLARSYELGMQYARLIKNFALDYATARNISSADIRLQLSRWIVLSLADLQKALTELKAEESMPPTRYIEILFKQIPGLSKKECDDVTQHLMSDERMKMTLQCGN